MAKGSVEDFRPGSDWVDRRYYSGRDLERIIEAAGGLPGGEVEHSRVADDRNSHVTVVVPRRVALRERLELAARAWDVNRQYANYPSAVQVAETLEVVGRAADNLIKALHLPAQAPLELLEALPPALRRPLVNRAGEDLEKPECPGTLSNAQYMRGFPVLARAGQDDLRDAVAGVYRLRDWSRDSATRAKDEGPTPREALHRGDTALNGLFAALEAIWKDVFGRDLTMSVGKPGTPSEGIAEGRTIRFFQACMDPLLGSKTLYEDAVRARIRRLRPSN